ncbi:MAG: hypothetical protein M3P23_01920, partial [Actinomycetota bacterium]|nr:hypothetical protein [Actinomycetota bacterium]
GACFVAGVFDAFLATYKRNIADLLRIATGGSGVLPQGHLHPDLVARVATEACRTADRFLGMVVRAFDFLPVVDVTFGDVVRAIVTADRALYPEDAGRLRATLVECLRLRGIYPPRISSLADEALSWPKPSLAEPLVLPIGPELSALIHSATQDLDRTSDPGNVQSEPDSDEDAESTVTSTSSADPFATPLTAWAQAHAVELGLDPDKAAPPKLSAVNVVYRLAADGQPRPQIVVLFQQRRRDLEDQSVPEELRVPMRAGTTLVAHIDGKVDRLVIKPLPLSGPDALDGLPADVKALGEEHGRLGMERFRAIEVFRDAAMEQDALSAWTATPALSRLTFAQLHSVIQSKAER